jgi:hypothetical protein
MENIIQKTTIYHAFSIGYRCNSSNFLNKHGHRIMSSPFDYMYIDIESALKCIQDEFANYTKDIVLFSRPKKLTVLFNEKNTTSVIPEIHELLDTEQLIYCNKEDYTQDTMFFNQNYIGIETQCDKMDLYKWKSICMFFHHNMAKKSSVETLERRSQRLLKCIYSRNTLFVYINQNTGFLHLKNEIDKYLALIAKYIPREKYPNVYFAIILYSEFHEDTYFYIEPCLFIIKKITKDKYWEDMDFDVQYDTLIRHFDIQLIEKHNLDNET